MTPQNKRNKNVLHQLVRRKLPYVLEVTFADYFLLNCYFTVTIDFQKIIKLKWASSRYH